jgi:hypothetical protein
MISHLKREIDNQQSIGYFEQGYVCKFTDKDTKGLTHDNMFDNDLSFPFIHYFETNVKFDEHSNPLTCEEKIISTSIIIILSQYYNIQYDKDHIPQYLQDNDYIRDYVKKNCKILHEDKVITKEILKSFQDMVSERDIL